MPVLLALTLLTLAVTQSAPLKAADILSRYTQAIGGEPAVLAVKTRISEGEYDNGRGLNTTYRIVEEAPNRSVTWIGPDAIDGPTGSGRGIDGATGWDKNFIGTGLRTLEGREMADAARDANVHRALHLFEDCATTTVEITVNANVVVCITKASARVRYYFDQRSGLLARQATDGARPVHIVYDDYRRVEALLIPFKTWIEVTGATLKYNARAIRHNQAVDRQSFARPASE